VIAGRPRRVSRGLELHGPLRTRRFQNNAMPRNRERRAPPGVSHVVYRAGSASTARGRTSPSISGGSLAGSPLRTRAGLVATGTLGGLDPIGDLVETGRCHRDPCLGQALGFPGRRPARRRATRATRRRCRYRPVEARLPCSVISSLRRTTSPPAIAWSTASRPSRPSRYHADAAPVRRSNETGIRPRELVARSPAKGGDDPRLVGALQTARSAASELRLIIASVTGRQRCRPCDRRCDVSPRAS